MSEVVQLSDITTIPSSTEVEPYNLVIGNVLGLDGLEYHLGLSRGDIAKYTEIMTTPLHRDMIDLFESNSWTLLPPLDVIKTIWDLFEFNQSLSTATLARRIFTQDLPEKPVQPYQYELMPVCTPDKLPIYIRGKRYDYPYSNLPRIETSIHPCFVIKSLCQYISHDNLDYAPNSLLANRPLKRLISEINITVSLAINLSWLHGTWNDYPERPAVAARPDPIPIVESSDEENSHTDSEDDGYATEPRDLYDPRALLVLQAMDAYMEKHNKRIEVEEAERQAQDAPPVPEPPIRSDSSLESINSTDVQPPTTVPPRRSQRVKPTNANVVQPTLASKKRARAAASSPASSVDEAPSKRQRSTRKQAAKKKSPVRSSPAADDSTASPPPVVRRSERKRKTVSR